RHATLVILLDARDLGTAEAAGDDDLDAMGAKTDRRLHRSLHGAAERHPALELLRDRLGDERGVDLGLAHLDDVQVNLGGGQPRKLAAQLLDIGALLANQNARTRRMHGDAAFPVRALDHDARDTGLTLLRQNVPTNGHVLVEKPAVFIATREPAAIPGAIDADAEADGIDFMTHHSRS